MATAANVFRDYETDGVPSSGAKKPKKSEIRQLLAGYEAIINAFTANGGLIYSSLAFLNADLAHAANSMAWVIGDATVGNNGIYQKQGASGTGSWTRVSDLPFSFIIASDVGAGTANSIQATTSIPVSESALVWTNIFETNTSSPVTISFNGGSALTIKAFDGSDILASGLTSGMVIGGFASGSTFRMISDQSRQALIAAINAAVTAAQTAQANAEAAQVAAETAQAGAEAAQDAAEGYRDQAAGYVNDIVSEKEVPITATRAGMESLLFPAGMISLETLGYATVGIGGARYIRVDSEPSHALKVRSLDRFLPNGSVDSVNGGWWEIDEPLILVEMCGAIGDNSTNCSTAIQAAIDYGNGRPGAKKGTEVVFGSGIYLAAGLTLKARVYLNGAGEGATIIRCPDGANLDVITIPSTGALFGISNLTIDGNSSNNPTAGSGIVIATVGSSNGNSFLPYNQKTESGDQSYKHLTISHVHVGNCREDGIRTEPSNYAMKMSNFVCSHNLRDGFNCGSSDGIFDNFYIEKNGRCGLWARGGANKWSSGKVIWNGRTDNTYGGLREQGSINVFINVEAQDNYTDGILILGSKPTFIGCHSNQNGYKAVGQETLSSETHADIRVGSSATEILLIGRVYTYKTAVGTDGKWTTQWPYWFNAFTAAQVRLWDVDFDPATYNAVPNVTLAKLGKSPIGGVNIQSTPGAGTNFDIDAKSPDGLQDVLIRLFRNAVTSGLAELRIHQKNSASYNHSFSSDAGAHVCRSNVGDFKVGQTGAGAWNTTHITLGVYHLWIDASGRLRIKSSAPTSDTDGAVVGTQT